MIRAMLAYKPEDRPSAEALLSHPYITTYAGTAKLSPASNVISLQAFTPGAAGGRAAGGGWQAAAECACARTGASVRVLACCRRIQRGLACTAAAAENSQPVECPASPEPPGPPAFWGSSSYSGSKRPGSSRQLTYRDALAGGAAAPAPGGDPGTPRTPGGTTVGFNVQKGRPASSMATPMVSGRVSCGRVCTLGAWHDDSSSRGQGGRGLPCTPALSWLLHGRPCCRRRRGRGRQGRSTALRAATRTRTSGAALGAARGASCRSLLSARAAR